MDHLDLTIQVEAPSCLHPSPIAGEEQKAMLKAGLLTSMVAITGISNPPIRLSVVDSSSSSNSSIPRTHQLLSMAFSIAACACLAVGALQIVIAVAIQTIPKFKPVVNRLREAGLALARFTIAYGASLVLLRAASPWFVLHVVFLSLQFMR